MKKIYSILALLCICLHLSAQTWDFTSVSATDKANLNADTSNWTWDSANQRWSSVNAYTSAPLTANGVELEIAKGIKVSAKAGYVRVDTKKKSLTMNGANVVFTISGAKAGQKVTVVSKSSSSSTARAITPTNVTITSGFTKSTDQVTSTGTVIEDGDITLTSEGGTYVFSIAVGEGSSTDSNSGNTGSATDISGSQTSDNSVAMNTANRQAILTTMVGTKYYNTADLKDISIDKTAGKVTVTGNTFTDEYTQRVKEINFSKAIENAPEPKTSKEDGKVEIIEANGWLESAFVKFLPINGKTATTDYTVYIKGGQYTDYTKIDAELIRNYGNYLRADVVGLKADDNYSLKVEPVSDATTASEVNGIMVKNYRREGFAFLNRTEGVGAYANDGTLKSNARILYITSASAKTVTCDVIVDSKGKKQSFTGLQTILDAYQKGYDATPLAIRFIGCISLDDLDHISSSAEGLQIKGKGGKDMNITLEGIGDDATTTGFGFLIRSVQSVELRNFANMLCLDDAVSLDTDNKHVWVHNLDLFYGNTGGDSDQAKGDGTIDLKGVSQYITISSNHLFDNGKASLCGMKSESGPNYISYDHNWFDHSDSRHPRIRTMSVHIWNNYYDGNSKYGVGVTSGADAFVEGNYFRNCKFPMMQSLVGNDVYAGSSSYNKDYGTFSGETPGFVKAFNNVITGTTSSYWAYGQDKVLCKGKYVSTASLSINTTQEFDCYEAKSRDEVVPSTIVANDNHGASGSDTYNNFDTDSSLMYTYIPDQPGDVPAIVTGYYGAGRMNHGDFKWTFDNAIEDTNASVITALKTALQNYKTSLK